ncbi:LacI family DNA-binding transcriptional regulator [Staphylococcus simiae]|uniref:Sucrose operon repressor ScrR, LacI family protein n=1 Tax=Staphylococcus simiae CCM 7213 = CCUG 51256 TaxID=911238 RepID=G5JH30_9STAP|nr:LacI family DNA-binding transcriptional regulator [Staphylococcus simiae]EHJ08517.1 Sucrose operon repressor ScrR, LacI family protein [Staphylococcus simiae CCM 7213 = CCUG 51256]PNZ09553.1 LacI family transcriptional regulator [Staphylococcus simiae]SNV58616.1 LacI family transcriptinal regulator [Staphylococcus simiae]
MKPKLEDVANLANVSKTTVSRVLNNRGYLSQQTKDKVENAMKQLNYQPNSAARQLYNQKTNIIGLLFPTVSNPFFGELIHQLETKLFEQGYYVIVGNSINNPDKEAHYMNQLLSNQVDGLIVGTHNIGIEEYNHLDLPIVAIDRIMNSDIPTVRSDNYNGGVQITQRLINSGIKKIIHTNGPVTINTPANLRQQAYEDVMSSHQLTPITYTIDFSLDFDSKLQLFKNIFKEHPDVEGIFASNDTDAIQIYNLALDLGYKVPETLKIIGYDGTAMIQSLMPNLTTVIQPIDDITTTAIQLLEQRMNNEQTNTEYVLPISIHQGTTG